MVRYLKHLWKAQFAHRLEDSEAKVLITTPELLERVPLNDLPALKTVFLVGDHVEEGGKTVAFNPLFEQASKELHIEWLGREDGLILHYTSGSTVSQKVCFMRKTQWFSTIKRRSGY